MLTVRQAMCSWEICINNGGILYWYIFLGVSECFNPEKEMVLTLPIKFSIRQALYKAAVSFTQLLYIFGILQTGRNWHFLVWVLTHCQEYWSTSVWPHRWISLFIFQIRLTIMDGGQWPKKIITYPLTQAPAYTLLFLNYQLTDRSVEKGSC